MALGLLSVRIERGDVAITPQLVLRVPAALEQVEVQPSQVRPAFLAELREASR